MRDTCGRDWKPFSIAFLVGATLTSVALASSAFADSLGDNGAGSGDSAVVAAATGTVFAYAPVATARAMPVASVVPTWDPRTPLPATATVKPTRAPTRMDFTPPPMDQSQVDALADGVVTFDEYASAVDSTLACVEERGRSHTEPAYDGSRHQFQYTIVGDSPGDSPMSAYDECWIRFERDIQAQWVLPEHGLSFRFERLLTAAPRPAGTSGKSS